MSYEAVMHHDPELLEREDAIAVEIEPADHGPALVQGQLLLRAQQPAEHPLQARRRDVMPSPAGGLRRVVRVHPKGRPQAPPPAFRVVGSGLRGLAGQPDELAAVQQTVVVGFRRRATASSSPSAAAMQPRSSDADTLPSPSLSRASNNTAAAAAAAIGHTNDRVLRR